VVFSQTDVSGNFTVPTQQQRIKGSKYE
jgi:hypothetical protein